MSEYKDILVISDTHKYMGYFNEVIKKHEDVSGIIHLGDAFGDSKYIENITSIPVVGIKGNCDLDANAPEEIEQVVFGHKIILTHGHQHNVKYSYDEILTHAKKNGANAILFGHTHIPFCEFEEKIWMINPGSLTAPKNGKCSYAILRVNEVGIIPKIFYI